MLKTKKSFCNLQVLKHPAAAEANRGLGRKIFEKFGRFPGATQFSEEKKQSGGNSGSLILYTNHKSFHCRLSFSDISTRYPKLNCYDFLIYILGYFLFHFTF